MIIPALENASAAVLIKDLYFCSSFAEGFPAVRRPDDEKRERPDFCEIVPLSRYEKKER